MLWRKNMTKKYAGVGFLMALMMSLSIVFGACGDVTATPAVNPTTAALKAQTLASQSVPTGVSSSLAVAFPATTQIYLALNTDSNSEQALSFQKMVAYLDNIPEVKTALGSIDVFKSAGLSSYDTDVKPWLGKEFSVGVTDVSSLTTLLGGATSMLGSVNGGKSDGNITPGSSNESNSQANPMALLGSLQNLPLLVGASVTDRAKAEDFASKLLGKLGMGGSPAKTDYKGASLYTVTGFLPLTIGVNGTEFLLASNDTAVKAAFDRTAGQGLDGNAKFKQIASKLPSGNLGFAYLDSQSVIGAVLNNPTVQQQLKSSGNTSTIANAQYADSMGLTFSTNADGLLVNSYGILLPDKESAEVKAMLARPANPSTILKALPASTFGFANVQNGSDSYDSFINTLTSMGSQGQTVLDAIKSFEQTSGLSIKNDAVSLFKGESAFFVNSQSQADHPQDLPVGLGLVSAVTDKAAAQASLDKITTAIEQAANAKNTSTQLKFESRTSNGVTFKTAGVPNTSSTFISLGLAGNYIFMSVDNQAASPVLTATTGGANFVTSPNAANFTKTQNWLVSDNQGYAYLDIQQAFGLVSALPASQQSQVKPFLTNLSQLKAVGMASHSTTTESSSSLFLYFPVTK